MRGATPTSRQLVFKPRAAEVVRGSTRRPKPHRAGVATEHTRRFLTGWFDRLEATGFDGGVFLDALSDDLVWTATGHSPVSGTFQGKQSYIALGANVSVTYQNSWTDTRTTEYTSVLNVPPGRYGWIAMTSQYIDVTGNFTLTAGNQTFKANRVNVAQPATDAWVKKNNKPTTCSSRATSR